MTGLKEFLLALSLHSYKLSNQKNKHIGFNNGLCFSFETIQWGNIRIFLVVILRNPDWTEHRFIFAHIVLQCMQQAHRMFRSEDDTRLHTGFRHPRHHTYKIKNKFRTRMRYNSKVGIRSLRHFFFQFYLQLTIIVLLFHISDECYKVIMQRKTFFS